MGSDYVGWVRFRRRWVGSDGLGYGFRFGVGGPWVCFELCFGLWMKIVVVWWSLLVVGSSVVAIDCI